MTKWSRARSAMERAHDDLFSDTRYEATFINYTGGSYNPDTGKVENDSSTTLGTLNVEIVPPEQDSTVDIDGTSFDWTTSIRLPFNESLVADIIPLGDDSEQPTQVEITDDVDNSTETFELHSYTQELGSGFVMARLIEE